MKRMCRQREQIDVLVDEIARLRDVAMSSAPSKTATGGKTASVDGLSAEFREFNALLDQREHAAKEAPGSDVWKRKLDGDPLLTPTTGVNGSFTPSFIHFVRIVFVLFCFFGRRTAHLLVS